MALKYYHVVGMMSGTSLDGTDLILCRFHRDKGKWNYKIHSAETFDYSPQWKKKLSEAIDLKAESLLLLNNEYGMYLGKLVNKFLTAENLAVDLVASHGHTIFHQPDRMLTYQLGSGAAIAASCQITTVSDFRTMDISLGGQGAPLVPVGDELLFNDYQFCLNLGGFANISNLKEGTRIACDICPVNFVSNNLALRAGYEFDKEGLLGSRGKIIPELVDKLNALDFYTKPGPKSLGREWVESAFFPVFERVESSPEDLLRSVYEHIAIQISNYINHYEPGKVLVTGGGAFNNFLMELIQQRSKSSLMVPDKQLVKFKEALIFAFLGLLRYLNRINCLASVTGARSDSSSGIVHRVILKQIKGD
jgi:anhydro-N-acetylmuramic acid kinase